MRGRLLGKGSHGEVRTAIRIADQQVVAVKKMDIFGIGRYIAREIDIHMSLEHKNIIRAIDVFLHKTHVLLVLEHAGGGDLFEYGKKFA